MKKYLVEIAWVFACMALVLLLSRVFTSFWNPKSTMDVHLHDTMYVISPGVLLVFFTPPIVFLLYLIKEKRRGYSNAIANIVFLIAGSFMILFFLPLGSLGNSVEYGVEQYNLNKTIGWEDETPSTFSSGGVSFEFGPAIIFPVITIFVLIAMLYVSYKWGRSKTSSI